MANNTEEWWSITPANGVETSLHQFGWSVTTVGGSRYDVPTRRGSNMAVAYRPGQFHRRKLPDARTITLVMFMVGWDPATGQSVGDNPTIANQRVQWNDNWDFLRRLVYENYLLDNRITLTRRWRLSTPAFPATRSGDMIIKGDPGTYNPDTGKTSSIITASGYAEMSSNMAPTMTGRTRADFQMDFLMADPYFYGAKQSATLNPGGVSYVWNDGHDVAAHAGLSIQLVGPLTNPSLRNIITEPDQVLTYKGAIASGQTVTLNVGNFTAIASSGIASTGKNRIANVSASGAQYWFNLLPGMNKISLTGTGSGHAVITWQPPYI